MTNPEVGPRSVKTSVTLLDITKKDAANGSHLIGVLFMNSLNFRKLRDQVVATIPGWGSVAFFVLLLFLQTRSQAEQLTTATIAGTNTYGILDGTNRAGQFWAPAAIACGSSSNLYVADGNAVRRLARFNSNWVVTTIAGSINSHGPDDGTNLNTRFNQPQGIAVDSFNNLFVADTVNNSIRKITLTGTNWVASTLAGLSALAGSADGTNSVARFNHPYGILASAGNLFVADTYNHLIRKIVTVGTNSAVTTIAGATGSPTSADGTNGNAHFNGPVALAADTIGNMYVADFADYCIRKMTPLGTNWVVTTIAGQPGVSGAVDGTNKTALFEGPTSLAVDAFGRIYVTDGIANSIRKIKPVGTNYVVSTVAGTPGVSG